MGELRGIPIRLELARTYRLQAASATVDGKTFIPVLSQSKVDVERRGTATVTVRMRRARIASDLAGAGLTATSATLVWRAPRGAEVRLRRSPGDRAPKSVSAGQAVKLSVADSRSRRATDTSLDAGSVYTYTLFSRLPGGRWVRSPALTMSTSAQGTPAYAVKPSTMLLTTADAGRASMGTDGTVVVDPPEPATLGAAVVLPPSAGLPTGYLGRVVSILPDGAVQLEPGDFASIFDYFSGSIDLANVPVQINGVQVDARGRARRVGAGGAGWGCELSSGVDFRPYYKAGGYFLPEIDWTPWHTDGAITLDVEMSPTIGADITTTTGASCGISAGVSQTFMAGPVPIYVGADFFGNVSASGSQKVVYRLKLGRQIKAQFEGGKLSVPLNRRISARGNPDVQRVDRISFGSQVTFGPGAGNRKIAGVVAGINGTMSYFKRSLTTSREGCARRPDQWREPRAEGIGMGGPARRVDLPQPGQRAGLSPGLPEGLDGLYVGTDLHSDVQSDKQSDCHSDHAAAIGELRSVGADQSVRRESVHVRDHDFLRPVVLGSQ